MPALFVIGLQEMLDLSAGNVVLDAVNDPSRASSSRSGSTSRAARSRPLPTSARRSAARTPPASFELVASHHLCGVAIMVFADASLRPHVHAVQAKAVATGNLGLGNKARGTVASSPRRRWRGCAV